jgi:hypothetical protein
MTFTHALATNNYGEAKFIVASSAANGTHTTIAAALTAAMSGDTIFIRQGTYTENITLKAGVNLCAYGPASAFFIPSAGGVIINGTCTMTTAGTVGIKGIVLQTNGATAALAVTGSAASIVLLENCYLNCTGNTGVTFSSSSGSAQIQFEYCSGDLTTTGIALFSHSSAGNLRLLHSSFGNSGGSTTNNTVSAGGFFPNYSSWANGTTLSNAADMNGSHLDLTMSGNQTGLTTANTSTVTIIHGTFTSGTSSAISIGAGTGVTLHYCLVSSSNANAIAGAGTISYTDIVFNSVASIQGTVTQSSNAVIHMPSITVSSLQPAFLATHTVDQLNVTGAGTTATVNFTTEIFDQNSNYDGTNTFQAPLTGRYQFNCGLYIANATASTFGVLFINTSNRNYQILTSLPYSAGGTEYDLSGSVLTDMDVSDTCIIQGAIFGMAGDTADYLANAGTTFFSGFLAC